jgi:hypothetical protein
LKPSLSSIPATLPSSLEQNKVAEAMRVSEAIRCVALLRNKYRR